MTTYAVPGMSCGHCRAAIEAALRAADPSATVAFDQSARTVTVGGALPDADVRRAIEGAGYEVVA